MGRDIGSDTPLCPQEGDFDLPFKNPANYANGRRPAVRAE